MGTTADEYDPLYLKGIAYFNACEFFEAHEVWEDLWKSYIGPLRLFYKGLIQAAVALHHFGNGNIRGARKVYGSSRGYVSQYGPRCEGLDVEKFLAEFDACFAEVAASVVLICGAALLFKSLAKLQQVDAGVRIAHCPSW